MDGEGLERVKLVVLRTSDVEFSTGFLERFRPRWMWRSQYLCPVTTSLEHLHFLPSVLRHLPGSGSMVPLPQYPVRSTDPPHPYVHIFKQRYIANENQLSTEKSLRMPTYKLSGNGDRTVGRINMEKEKLLDFF